MRQLVGHADCINEYEAECILDKLKGISSGALIHTNGLHIDVTYTPLDTESDLEVRTTVARILDTIEEVTSHGFSMISGGDKLDKK